MTHTNTAVQEKTAYIAIIQDFGDGTCKYGFYDASSNLILGTIGYTFEVKELPEFRNY